MIKYKVIFYEKENGECPIDAFLDELSPKMRAKMIGLLDILEEYGNQLREPYSKPLGDGIFELRCQVGTDISRALYFFYYEGKIVITNGFIKKTKKAPAKEIALAKKRREDWKRRENRNEDIGAI